jgi:formamidase
VHNRWHPDIEPAASIRVGEEITLECEDGLAGQLTRASVHDDVVSIDHGKAHALAGPVYVEGAEPGDVLEVEFLAFEHGDFGFTAVFPGFGFLADLFPEPYLMKWDVTPDAATTPDLPGIRVPPAIFPGVVGVAPSHELMSEIRGREEELKARGGAVADEEPGSAIPKGLADGLRTIPPREIGGNLDTRQLIAGSRLFLPVHVPGALLSVGDVHYAQGDGESNGTGLEIAASVTIRAAIRKSPAWRTRFPSFETPPVPPRRRFGTTGMPVTPEGRNESLDLSLATRGALLDMLGHLTETYGFTREAAYCLISVAVDLHLSEIVDIPNPVVSALLPLDIFER